MITLATAAIALPPQIAVPTATSSGVSSGTPSTRPSHEPERDRDREAGRRDERAVDADRAHGDEVHAGAERDHAELERVRRQPLAMLRRRAHAGRERDREPGAEREPARRAEPDERCRRDDDEREVDAAGHAACLTRPKNRRTGHP